MSEEVEAARAALRAEIAASSLRDVAARVGVAHSALHDFTRPGSTGRPIGRNLTPMLDYVRRRRATPASPAAAPSLDADPSWWAGYLAAANETLRHAHAMIGGANEQIAHMLRNRAQWQRTAPPEQPDPFAEFPAYDFSPAAEAAREEQRAAEGAERPESGRPASQPARRRRAG